MVDEKPKTSSESAYVPPKLDRLGSAADLTLTGGSGAAEAGSSSSNKKRASILG
jgi:hypothetical protein